MRIDRMGIQRPDTDTRTDAELYGSLYLVCQRHNGVNDYGGSDSTDVAKLTNITTAAAGSTCLFDNGDIYRLNIAGEWVLFGEEESTASAAVSPSVSPLNLDRSISTIKTNTAPSEVDTDFNEVENAEPLDAVEVTENDK